MNMKHVTHVTKQDEEPPIARMTLHSKFILILKKILFDVGPPPKPNLFLHVRIPITPLFGITEFNSCLF